MRKYLILCFVIFSSFTFPTEKFQSQASQDHFVYSILYELLHKQDHGWYLEIGASQPVRGNNTYFLENSFGWKGISIDISDQYQNEWKINRTNTILIEDATKVDYALILKEFPQEIDYLSLDVDEAYDIVLKRIPLERYQFKVITIEHDAYKYGDLYRQEERKILKAHGYFLLCPDVICMDSKFEDWWVHPSIFPSTLLAKLKTLDLGEKDHTIIINSLKNLKCCF